MSKQNKWRKKVMQKDEAELTLPQFESGCLVLLGTIVQASYSEAVDSSLTHLCLTTPVTPLPS